MTSFSKAPPPPDRGPVGMARWEIHKRFGFVDAMWWRFMPGTEIKVRWPVGQVVIDEDMPQWDWTIGPSKYVIDSADPNDHYRPWLERNVGRQGWDWNWRLGPMAATNDTGTVIGFDSLFIKFRRGRDRYATMAAMRWA